MRRVDEAMKQVLSEAIPTLKDPRIGFVTVTAVETSRDLDHAKVWRQRVRERAAARARRSRRSPARRGVLQARVNRELKLRRTPQLEFVYDRAVEHGVRMTQLIDELAPTDETTMQRPDMSAVAAALPRARSLRRHLAREPGRRRRSARCSRCTSRSSARQGLA